MSVGSIAGPLPASSFLLINPNTSLDITQDMLALAQQAMPAGATVTALTARSGPAVIVDPHGLALADQAVMELASDLPLCDGVILAGFGDPGVAGLRGLVEMPVTGIGEAAYEAARRADFPFAVITTTPALVGSITHQALAHLAGPLFVGVFTPDTDDPATLMADRARTEQALADLIDAARAAGARQLIVGGGPLARAASALAQHVAIPVIDPVKAAVDLALERAPRPATRP